MNKSAVITVLVIIVLAIGVWYVAGMKRAAPMQGGVVEDWSATSSSASGTSELAGTPLSEQLAGTWRSSDDAKFTRSFTADGKVTDAYQGDASATETGTYAIVNPAQEKALPVPAASVAGMSVLRIDFPKSGTLYFSINALSDGSLQMTYLGRGNILSFTRVQ